MREKLFQLLQTPWFIALFAVLLRLGWLLYKISVIPANILATAPFENEVGNVASAIATGQGFCCLFRQPTGPTAWLSPVYPLLIAGVFKVFGTFALGSFCVSVFLNSLFSALTCFPLFYGAVRVAGKFAALLATWLWAVSPIAIILPYAWIWDSSLSALLAASLLAGLKARLPDTTQYYGIGGPRMTAAGFDVHWPMEKLSVRGYVEALRHIPEILRIRNELKHQLLADPPDAFIGVDAIDPSTGAMAQNESEASINRLMARQAARVIVVADSSKVGRRAFARICAPGDVDVFVTDTGLTEADRIRFADAGVQVITA